MTLCTLALFHKHYYSMVLGLHNPPLPGLLGALGGIGGLGPMVPPPLQTEIPALPGGILQTQTKGECMYLN